MNKLKMFVIAVALFLIACDVNFGDLAVPNNEASYTIKIINEQYDIATEMLKYAKGVTKNSSGELCLDTTIVYNENSDITSGKISFTPKDIYRKGPFYLSISPLNFNFPISAINGSLFGTLGSGTTVNFSEFSFESTKINSYNTFKDITIKNAFMRVTAKNCLGFPIDSLTVVVCDSLGNGFKTFDFSSISSGSSLSSGISVTAGDNIKYTKYVSVKAKGTVGAQGNITLYSSNYLEIQVSFDYIGTGYKIETEAYCGYAPADTVTAIWENIFAIDNDNNGTKDFDVYTFNTTSSIKNLLNINFISSCADVVSASFTLPGIYTSSARTDTLSSDAIRIATISNSGSSTTQANSLSFANRYLGEAYSTGSSLFDTVKIKATFVFPASSYFVRMSEDKISVGLTLDSLGIDNMVCKVNEDVAYGGVSGTIPVSLNRFYVTDENGNTVPEVDLLGNSDISYTMNRVILAQGSSPISNIIDLKVNMSSSRNSNSRSYNDSVSLGIYPWQSISYSGSLSKDTAFLNLLKILPENFTYSIKPTIKASNNVISINANDNLALNVSIKSPIQFNTGGKTLIFELRKDYGSGFEGMYKEFTSAQLTNDIYKHYIKGDLVLNYKNTSNMMLGAKVIISTDKSVLYNDNIITTATTSTVGTSGYPSYIARVISLGNLQPNTTSGTVSASLTQKDLEPFLQDSCYIGVKIPIKSSSASFSGQLDLVGKIQFDYNNLGSL